MGKKCIPGIICIENMTLFVLVMIFILIIYIYYIQYVKPTNEKRDTKIVIVSQQQPIQNSLATIASRPDPFNDPYSPPLKTDGIYIQEPPVINVTRGLSINVQSRGINSAYQQMGILTRSTGSSQDLILPLMGRRIMTGRDKWQYYTISNTGNLNTKLPVSVNGKSCTSEYGCDNITNGDNVYVEGYSDIFKATVYENNLFNYIPF